MARMTRKKTTTTLMSHAIGQSLRAAVVVISLLLAFADKAFFEVVVKFVANMEEKRLGRARKRS